MAFRVRKVCGAFETRSPGHSTETALLRVFNEIFIAMDQRKVIFFALLDLSATFVYTVDHGLLLYRFNKVFGVTGTALSWFESYLSNRRQRVSINGNFSDPRLLKFGVSQGSVLGPLLVVVYISRLGDIIRQHGLDYHLYADDMQLYLAFDCNAICDIKQWLNLNLFLIGSSQQLSKLNNPVAICLQGIEIVTAESVKVKVKVNFIQARWPNQHLAGIKRGPA